MAFADEKYYREIYKGAEVGDDLSVLLERASDMVQAQVLYRLDDLEKLPSFMKENIKKATCAQVEFINANGGLEWFGSGNYGGFTIGKFSMSGSSGASGKGSQSFSGTALAYLEAAGLLYRGGGAL